MCGICGFTWEDKALLKKMMDSLAHRGPDDSGSLLHTDMSLGHMRLSIIDLSRKGRQPMSNENGDIWIAFNGEIYNHLALRGELEGKGHRFLSRTDTEAIIHGYEEWGTSVVNKLNGFFAFAIYDNSRKSLFIARDRLGIKPLYFARIGKRREHLVFASEVKAIVQHEIKREMDLHALHDFLSFRCVTTQDTMFRGIKRLLPGHFIIKDREGFRVIKYWDIGLVPEKRKRSADSYADELLQRFEDSVKMRMMSDVPVGAYLSGGIDSGSVVAMMSKYSEEPVKTFSVGFGLGQHRGELERARAVAERFGTEHNEITVSPDTAGLLPKIVWHHDEPMSDPTSIPTYILSQHAKKKCTVILTGEGADEQFSGYFQYKIMKAARHSYVFPRFLRRAGASSARLLPKAMLNRAFSYSGQLGEEGLRRFVEFASSKEPAEGYLSIVSIFTEEEKSLLFTKDASRLLSGIDIRARLRKYFSEKGEYLDRLMKLEAKTILPEDLLMKVDRNTMAHSVEARVPFLDHTLLEYSFSIPQSLKLRFGTEKYILRKAMRGILPESTLKTKKTRFFVPIDSWFGSELKDTAKSLLSPESLRKMKYIEPRYVERCFRNFNSSRLFYSRQLWSLMNLRLWHRIFIEDNAKKLPPKGIDAMV